jgi:alpha-glucosidase
MVPPSTQLVSLAGLDAQAVVTDTVALGAGSVLAEALTMSPWHDGTSPRGSVVLCTAWAEYVGDAGDVGEAVGNARHSCAFADAAAAADTPGASPAPSAASTMNTPNLRIGTPNPALVWAAVYEVPQPLRLPAVPWWQSAVVYQIYPRSFRDDLNGIRNGLDHIASLGVDAIWLSPVFRSPMADFGYDVADYCDIDPQFGTLADMDALIAEAHERGIRVLLDWVPNHTSDQHPWFHDPAKHDWYIWRDGTPDRPPNNWQAAFTNGPAWTWDDEHQQWYLHLFLPQQPDLNWANPAVVAAMHDVLRFWLDRGVDGFRIDVVHGLGKDPALPDDPPVDAPLADLPHASLNDHESTHGILRDLRRLLDSYPGDRVMVGEVYLLDTGKVARYYGARGDELHLAFNFPPLYTAWDAAKWRRQIERAAAAFDPIGAWPTWVLSNHDNPRHRTRYGGPSDDRRARAAAVLLLTLRGTPFLYAGEELGLEDAAIPPDRVVDPGGRDGCRAPIPWTPDGPAHGWATDQPWLPWPPEPEVRNVATEDADPGSILNLYRRLLAARRASPALREGSLTLLDGLPDGVLGYQRRSGSDHLIVFVNFTNAEVHVGAASGEGDVLVGTGAYEDGVLGPAAAVLIRSRNASEHYGGASVTRS